MRITSIGGVLAVAGGIACSSSPDTGPAEGGPDGSGMQADASPDASSEADGSSGGLCNQSSDCPATGGGACVATCSDGTNPCARECVAHACEPRNCPDAAVIEGQIWCNQTSDCPPNTRASCASVCSDGSNPCVNACVGHQCVSRGCPDAGTTSDGGQASDAGDAGHAADAGCAGTAPNCFGNDVQTCCGQDPAGPAACVGGTWRCGSAPAPGCNGTSCLLGLDASAG